MGISARTTDVDLSVAAEEITHLLHESMQHGLQVASLLRELSLPPDLLDREDNRVPVEDCWRIITAHQNRIDEESHLMSARPLKRGTTRLVFSHLAHCDNLQGGLEALAETYNVAHGGDYNMVRRRGQALSYVVDDSNFHYRVPPSHLALEFALLRIHCAVSLLCGRPLPLLRIATRRETLPTMSHHLELFGAPVQIAQAHYELVYDLSGGEPRFSDTARKADSGGDALAEYLALRASQPTPTGAADLEREVLRLLRQGNADPAQRQQGAVATALGMSIATLRRRLNSLGTSFRQLLDQANRELAANRLLQQESPAAVAEHLGYSDLRSFRRAFQRWYGVTPAAYVAQNHLIH